MGRPIIFPEENFLNVRIMREKMGRFSSKTCGRRRKFPPSPPVSFVPHNVPGQFLPTHPKVYEHLGGILKTHSVVGACHTSYPGMGSTPLVAQGGNFFLVRNMIDTSCTAAGGESGI